MKRALIAAGAVLILAGPALADTLTIEKKTITRDEPAETGSTVSTVVVAPNPPPAPQAEVPPPPPGPAVVWVGGHWAWDPGTHAYLWVHGDYREPPRAHAAWQPGHWSQRDAGWVWVEGRWD